MLEEIILEVETWIDETPCNDWDHGYDTGMYRALTILNAAQQRLALDRATPDDASATNETPGK